MTCNLNQLQKVFIALPSGKHIPHTALCTQQATHWTLHLTRHTVCILYTAHCTVWTHHCTLYTAHNTPHTVHWTLYCTQHAKLHCTLTQHVTQHTLHTTRHTFYTNYCTQHAKLHYTLHTTCYIMCTCTQHAHTVNCTQHATHCTLHTTHHTTYTAHHTLYSAHNTLHTVRWTLNITSKKIHTVFYKPITTPCTLYTTCTHFKPYTSLFISHLTHSILHITDCTRARENLKLAGNWPKVAAMCGLQKKSIY